MEVFVGLEAKMKEWVARLCERYHYASILHTRRKGRRFIVMDRVERIGFARPSAGFAVKLLDDEGFREFYLPTIDDDALEEMERASRGTSGSHPWLGRLERIMKESAAKEKGSSASGVHPAAIMDPERMESSEILERLRNLQRACREPWISRLDLTYSYTVCERCFADPYSWKEEKALLSSCHSMVTVSMDGDTRYCFHVNGRRGGVELIDEIEEGTREAARTARELIGAGPPPAGEHRLVVDPDVAGLIAHEAFGHGVELDMILKRRSNAEGYFGSSVASDLVSMYDDPTLPGEYGSYSFDDEGVAARRTCIVENGILTHGLSDLHTALRLGLEPDHAGLGHGRRESFSRKAYARMSNTYFGPGESSREELIESMDEGFLIQYASNGMEDPRGWGIHCEALVARKIRNGRLTGEIFTPVTITGYVPELLSSIDGVGDDLRLFGGGACGKGRKEFVEVSDGGPTLRLKARLG